MIHRDCAQDEIDYLLTKKQSVLYNLLHWPTAASSRLLVVGISNTLDFADRLVPRVRSRLGMNRLTFAPYSRQQLQLILSQRLHQVGFHFNSISNKQSEQSHRASTQSSTHRNAHDCDNGDELIGTLFHPDAVELCARKVAALSGDARRALQIWYVFHIWHHNIVNSFPYRRSSIYIA